MFSTTTYYRGLATVLLLASFTQNVSAKPLKISTDIPFVASLVQAIVGEQDSVTSLMSGQESPHDFALRPRDLRQLQTANLVVMIGETLSPNVARTIRDVAIDVPTLAMLELPELQNHIANGREHEHDPHIWLDPIIVTVMATAIGDQLAKLDPIREKLFKSNAKQVAAVLEEFHNRQITRWAHRTPKAFVTLHEVSHYFQQRYNLNSVGSLFEGDHGSPSAKHLRQLQERMRASNVECVITDPNTSQRWVDTLTNGQSANGQAMSIASINILGSTDNNTHYLNVLTTMSEAFAKCLGVP